MVETPGESQSRDSFPTRSCVGLEVERPPNFRYRPADYVFVRCPEVSRLDWHPFSISSAPEEENILAIHICATGSRTGALYELFNKMRPVARSSRNAHAGSRAGVSGWFLWHAELQHLRIKERHLDWIRDRCYSICRYSEKHSFAEAKGRLHTSIAEVPFFFG